MQLAGATTRQALPGPATCVPGFSGGQQLRAAAPSARRPTRRAAGPAVAARGKRSEADLYRSVDGSGAAAPAPAPAPWYVTVPLGFVATVAVLRTVGAVMRRCAGPAVALWQGTAAAAFYYCVLGGVRAAQGSPQREAGGRRLARSPAPWTPAQDAGQQRAG